jgi:hypothetical protein
MLERARREIAAMALIDLTFIKDWVRICRRLVLGFGSRRRRSAQPDPNSLPVHDSNSST